MHELGMCEALVEAVERRAQGRQVTAVRIRAGAQHRVVESAMAHSFELASAGTVAEGAGVDLVVVPVRIHCRGCALDAEAVDPWAVCTRCGSADLEMTGGDELLLESVTYDTPADAQPADAQPADAQPMTER